jgi:diguanylate cyclase (GGDEF)-like protein
VYDAGPTTVTWPPTRSVQEPAVSDARPSQPRPPLQPLRVLSTAAAAIAREPDLDGALGILLGTAADAVGARAGAVYLQDPDRAGLEPLLAVGLDEAGLERLGTGVDVAADPVASAARERMPVDVREAGALGAFGGASGCGSATFRPLVASRGGIDLPGGVLVVGWDGIHEVSADEDELLEAIAGLAAVAIDRWRLGTLVAERSEWFERVAHSDPLTGLANQRTFARVLELELARAGRQGGQVSVALVDIDDFGETNARAGHEAGDDVLRAVASILAESVRLVDTVARHGGDEFIVVAPGSAGVTVARRILAAVGALPPVDGRPVSVSIGVARFPADGTSSDELIAAARNALETARAAGRGGIAEATPQPTR